MGFQLKRLAFFFRECFVHLMFLIISFPRATRKPEDQQVSVLSSAQASTGRLSICLSFFVFWSLWTDVSLSNLVRFFWQKKMLFFSFFPVENAEDYFSVLLKYFRREKERRGGSHSVFLSCQL